MNQTSLHNIDFDNRLLETEELYRQRKPEIAAKRVRTLLDSGFTPKGYELGLFKFLVASELYFSGKYQEAVKIALEANKLLAASAFHSRIGRIHLLLNRNYTRLGELRTTEKYAHSALAFFRQAGDNAGMIDALNSLGQIAFIQGNFTKSIEFVGDAIDLAKGDNIRILQLVGNLGRIEILNGDWDSAEEHLKTALKLAGELDQNRSFARNHLSLGYLYLRQRKLVKASLEFKAASYYIEKEDFKWEYVDQLEYEGELAYEQGDMVQAKNVLKKAYALSRDISPDSTLGSQIIRRLAQVEFALDNFDEALKLAQKSLDIATRLGEKAEIGMSMVVIAQVFAARENFESAFTYIQDGLETLRKAGDPYDVSRALIIQAEIYDSSGEMGYNVIDKCYEEAFRIFNKLKLFYWSGETRFRQGKHCCKNAKISTGFKRLLESENVFEKISEKSKIRSVRLYKQELSKQAVAASVSGENEFKIFGDYFSDIEYSNLKSGQINEILDILGGRTRSSRVVIYKTDNNSNDVVTNLSLSAHQGKKFVQHFGELLGEEFATDKPTLILDSRHDPFINELLRGQKGENVSSVIVVPLALGQETVGYVYMDRVTRGNSFIPFGQSELNFAVGFADLISLKLAEYEKFLLEEDNKRLKAQLMEETAFPNIITQNKQMLEMLSRVQQVVNSNISISITGDTGSGKDLLAKTIHYNSNRRDKRFVSVNCAALPESLLESELFGYRKGAFTGADRDKVGLFEEADNGTFFLDEIADMPLSIQAKVLRILEEKEIVRLGETKPIKVDVRIVSATNKDLKTEMETGTFRQDLYYRLTALCFRIPALKERNEDIPLLINHFSGDSIKYTPETMKQLIAFDWPGNVRELENEIKKLTLLAGDKGIVDVGLLSDKITEKDEEQKNDDRNLNVDVHFDSDFSLYDYLAEYERRFIVKALREQSGVKKHAAKFLNIPESTLRLKIKQYNIGPGDLSAVG